MNSAREMTFIEKVEDAFTTYLESNESHPEVLPREFTVRLPSDCFDSIARIGDVVELDGYRMMLTIEEAAVDGRGNTQ